MLISYCDLDHDTIINQMNRYDGVYGVEKIKKIFFDVKNSVYYNKLAPMQKASETLVMGRGNNIDKNILLYTLLKAADFKCNIRCAVVMDNTKRLICRYSKEIPWYYVEVDYFGRTIILDASFDNEFMRAAGIVYKGNNKDYDFSYYYTIDGKELFIVIEKMLESKDEEAFDFYGSKMGHAAM